MFVHMSIHYPRQEKEQFLIESMHRFGETAKELPGLISVNTLKDEDTGRVIGLAIWETREQWEEAMPKMHQAVKDDPFNEWEMRPPEIFHLYPL